MAYKCFNSAYWHLKVVAYNEYRQGMKAYHALQVSCKSPCQCCKLSMSQLRCALSCLAAGSGRSLGTPTLSLKYEAAAMTGLPGRDSVSESACCSLC